MLVNRAFYGAVSASRPGGIGEKRGAAHGPGRGQYSLGKRKVVAPRSPPVIGPRRVVAKALARLRRVDRAALTAADAVVFLPF
jgi:hypothetical protein